MKIRLENGDVLTERAFRALHPNISFGAVIPVADYGASFVTEVVRPDEVRFHRWEPGSIEQTESGFTEAWVQVPFSLSEAKAVLLMEVAQKRRALEMAGVEYNFPSGAGVVQTRDANDKVNINGIVTSALIAKGAGVTDPVIQFRDESNVWRYMTPDQAMAFGQAVASAILNLAQAKAVKDAEVEALQTIENCVGYDVEAGW